LSERQLVQHLVEHVEVDQRAGPRLAHKSRSPAGEKINLASGDARVRDGVPDPAEARAQRTSLAYGRVFKRHSVRPRTMRGRSRPRSSWGLPGQSANLSLSD